MIKKEIVINMDELINDVKEKINSNQNVLLKGDGESMYPFITNKDTLVLVRPPKKVKIGEIYLYKRQIGGYAIHRVYTVKKDYVLMLGDAQLFIERVDKDSLIATEKTLVMFMNKHRVITPCANRCRRHDIVAKHLMQMVAKSNMKLLDKITHISKKTIRDKLMSYFTTLAKKKGSNYFDLPFNKTELASYLSVDRSAMSTELTKMKEDGLIEFEKKQFHLLKKE